MQYPGMNLKIPFTDQRTDIECRSSCSLIVTCSEEWQKKCPVRTQPFLLVPVLISVFFHIAFFVAALSMPADGIPYDVLRGVYHVFLSNEQGELSEYHSAQDQSPLPKSRPKKERENQMPDNTWDVEIVKGKKFDRIILEDPYSSGSDISQDSAVLSHSSDQDTPQEDTTRQKTVLLRGPERETIFFDWPSQSIPVKVEHRYPLIKENAVVQDHDNPLYGLPDMNALLNYDIKVIISLNESTGQKPVRIDDIELEHLSAVIMAHELLSEQLGRDPGADEIAGKTGLTIQKTEKALALITAPATRLSDESRSDSHIILNLLKKRHPITEQGAVSGKEEEIEGTKEYSSSKHIFSVVHAAKGLYNLHIQNTQSIPFEISVLFILYEGDDHERRRTYPRVKLLANDRLTYKFLLPEALFWDDTDSFTGTIEDSYYVTKFIDRTGLVWKERKNNELDKP